MTALFGAAVGLMASFGVVLVAAAVIGYGLPTIGSDAAGPERNRKSSLDRSALLVGVVGGLTGWLVTGLVAIGFLILGGAIALPLFRQARLERSRLVDRTEALAAWAESLRDYVKSHAGLRQAVVAGLPAVDEVIMPEVEALAQDLEQETPALALGRFADRLADPVGDLLATALTVALGESGARDVPGLLGQLAADAREEVSGVRRVSVAHEKAFGTARAMAVVVAATAVGMFVVNGDYLRVYRTGAGQIVLMIVAVVVLLAVRGLVRMARPVQPLRVLTAASQRSEVARR